MQIRHSALLFLLLVCSAAPALAAPQQRQQQHGGYMVDTSNLQLSTFNKSPLQVQILDNSPRVSDHRHPAQVNPLIIAIPPLPNAQAVQIPVGAVPIGNGIYAIPSQSPSANRSNPMVDLSNLPQAGYQSNIPAQPISTGRNLAPGFATGVHANMAKPPHAVSGAPAFLTSKPTRPAANSMQSKQQTAMYTDQMMSVGCGSRSTTTSSVKGTVINKLLQKQN